MDNLFLAGRCISVTHAALGTVRVMGTTALMGQAVGTAAVDALHHGVPTLAADAAAGGPLIQAIQERLLRAGIFLPNRRNQDLADLARSATVSSSSNAYVVGVGQAELRNEAGLSSWGGGVQSLDQEPAQLIAVAGGRIDRGALCLDVAGDQPVRVPLRLTRLADLFDYRRDGDAVLAETVVEVPPGAGRWVDWPVALTGVRDGYVRLQAGPVAGAGWRRAIARLPDHPAQCRVSPTRLRSQHHTLAFRIEPGQPAYAAPAILSGRTRPGNGPECWRSDPGQGFPQWLDLSWSEPQRIARIELTFPGQLCTEVHAEPPFFNAAQNASDYTILIEDGAGWREVLRITGNRNRRRDHDLPTAAVTRRLRIRIDATGGDPSAAISEVRCYSPQA